MTSDGVYVIACLVIYALEMKSLQNWDKSKSDIIDTEHVYHTSAIPSR